MAMATLTRIYGLNMNQVDSRLASIGRCGIIMLMSMAQKSNYYYTGTLVAVCSVRS